MAKKSKVASTGQSRREKEREEIKSLEEKCKSLSTSTEYKTAEDGSSKPSQEAPYTKFDDLPLSEKTLKGLSDAGFVNMTDVQKDALPRALRGDDVLGAAKTGSGKTLAFLVPVIEKMYRGQWSSEDGVGALIISPTRELAYQSFEVLRKIGKYHDISAGLIIGGKNLEQEKERINKMNVIICTPGRLLQHMDETAGFECPYLQMLVLDEADRILDMGFQSCLNSIIENLPVGRQTLLFSATQTKSVKDLARLSLKDPEYVSVHENAKFSTPAKLMQSYIEVGLDRKIDVLWSFVKTHLKTKCLVFLSSCKQVRFVHECFRKLRPGVPVMALFGKQKQAKRMAIYDDFARKEFAVMFCTDIAARGLDFPAVDWVIQMDCPEDVNTYLHRVGRTARFEAGGHALLFLTPSEAPGMTKELKEHKVPIKAIKMNPKKNYTIVGKLQGFCAQDPDMKYLAQKCFISYMRSVYLQSNKDVFDVHKLPGEKFAVALGLPNAPRIRFIKKKKEKIMGPAVQKNNDDGEEKDDNEETSADSKEQQKSHIDKIMSRSGNSAANLERLKKIIAPAEGSEDDDEDGDFLTVKKVDHALSEDEEWENDLSGKKKKMQASKAKILKRSGLKAKKTKFDDNGNVVESDSEDEEEKLAGVEIEKSADVEIGGIDLEASRKTLASGDREDKLREKSRLKAIRQKEKEKIKELQREMMGETGVQLDIPSVEYEEEDMSGDSESNAASDRGSDSDNDSATDEEENGVPKRAGERDEFSPSKRRKIDANTVEEDEAMALQLLGGF